MTSKHLLFLLPLLLLCGCGSRTPQDRSTIINSMQLIDRNGFAETISSKDRIKIYQEVDFLTPQPYQKVLRVYGRNLAGQSTAKVTSYHDNGQLWQYLEVVDGRAHGFYREWFPNGQMKIETTIIEGLADIHELAEKSWVFDGSSRVWDERGHLTAEIFYEKGVLHTPSLYYHQNGMLQKIIPYQHGNIDGDILVFDDQGNLLERIPYIKGVMNGKAVSYWEKDHLLSSENYQEGLLLEAEYYDVKGKSVASIEKGKGQQALFKDDLLHTLISYHEGIPEGLVSFFRPDQSLKTTYHLKEGKKEGEEIEYYPSGKPKLSIHWHEGVIQGVVKTWYANGVIESQREINNNKKQGLSFAWYQNGDVMLMEEYDNNLLIKASYFKKGDKTPVSKIDAGKGTATLHTGEGVFLKKISYEKGHPKLSDDPLR